MIEHVAAYINYLRAEKGFSLNTISAYQNDLAQLAAFVTKEPVVVVEENGRLSRDQVVRFVQSVRPAM